MEDPGHDPVAFRTPGFFVEELTSEVRAIPAVDTAIPAFLGWAARGPTARAVRVSSFQDFERHFGGLDRRSLLGYCVQHFFANGGRQAWVVRLVADDAVTARVVVDDRLVVSASSPGAWAHAYRIEIQPDSRDATGFALAVIHQPVGGPAVRVESFGNLSMQETAPRFVSRVVTAESALVHVALTGAPTDRPLESAAVGFSIPGDDGTTLHPNDPVFETRLNPVGRNGGIHLLEDVDPPFDLLCVPGETKASVVASLQKFCRDRRAFLLVDSPKDATVAAMRQGPMPADPNSALYFPWVQAADPLDANRVRSFPPCGFVAGIYARMDRTRGVWKAPAGKEAVLTGAVGTDLPLSDDQQGILNPYGINCIRSLPRYGPVVWGSRTIARVEETGPEWPEWRYVAVRRLALLIENSLLRGLAWVVFEPNDEILWSKVRLAAAAFLQGLFRQGAFQGSSPQQAFFVSCGLQTMTPNDISQGRLNLVVGFAPLRPAEYVVLRLQAMTCPWDGSR